LIQDIAQSIKLLIINDDSTCRVFWYEYQELHSLEIIYNYWVYHTQNNGVHPSTIPTGGACVLSVIRFQDGGRRSAVVSAEARKWYTTPKCIDKRLKNWLDWKVHITPKTQAYDLCSLLFNIIVFAECPGCPNWK
jgi:hypothetical protein